MIEFSMGRVGTGSVPAYPISLREALDQADPFIMDDMSPVVVRYPALGGETEGILVDITDAATPHILAGKIKMLVPGIAELPTGAWVDSDIKCHGFKYIKIPDDATLWSAGVREGDLVRIIHTQADSKPVVHRGCPRRG